MFLDAEIAVCAWLNSRADLTGPGQPIAAGAYLDPIRSPNTGAYLLISRLGGGDGITAERTTDRARISAQAFGDTLEAARRAAYAYAGALDALTGARTPMGDVAVCLGADQITGPLQIPAADTGREAYRYMVDADLLLTSALLL